MGFDYGCDVKDLTTMDDYIKVWPTDGETTALIDADAIPYIIGYTSDLQQYLKMKRMPDWKASDIFKEKCNHANFILNKWVNAAGCDSAMLFMTNGSSNFRLKIGKTKVYKGQRVEEKPPFFYELREWLLETHGAHMSCGCEADDDISKEAWKRIIKFYEEYREVWTPAHKRFSNFVVVSGDKDLAIIPTWRCPPDGVKEWVDPIGELRPTFKIKEIIGYEYWPLFNGIPFDPRQCFSYIMYKRQLQMRTYDDLITSKDKWQMDIVWYHLGAKKDHSTQDLYSRGKNTGKGKFQRVQGFNAFTETMSKLKGTGLKFFYSQLLTGDTVDNYCGLPGCGMAKAFQTLDSATTEIDLYSRVHYLYVKKYGDQADVMLLEQGQLAHMQTEEDELWQPPRPNKLTFPL